MEINTNKILLDLQAISVLDSGKMKTNANEDQQGHWDGQTEGPASVFIVTRQLAIIVLLYNYQDNLYHQASTIIGVSWKQYKSGIISVCIPPSFLSISLISSGQIPKFRFFLYT